MITMPYVRNSLDDKLVSVWTTRQGQRTSDTAIISAHGETPFINGTFPPGNYSLVFFCPHGHDLVDPGLVKFWERKVEWQVPIVTSPFCQDYVLTKYQGKHNKAGETYELIQNLPDQVWSQPPDIITVSPDTSGFSFLTFGDSIKLSALITMIFEKRYHYTSFHCSFCRGTGPLIGEDPSYAPVVYN
jgi:hypothetical protein